MASYNNAMYIAEAIESVKKQTYQDWELIVVDDFSLDNSSRIIKKYLNDKRIKFYKNKKNLGYIATLGKMIEYSSSEIIGVLDSDDVLDSEAIREVVSAYKNNPQCGFIYTRMIYCDKNLNKTSRYCGEKIPENKSNMHSNYIGAFRTFKKNVFSKTSGFDSDILYAEDKDIILKFEEITSLFFVDKPLYFHRYLKKSQSHEKTKSVISSISHVLAKYKAYKRRLRTDIPNLNKNEMAQELTEGLIQSIKIKDTKKIYFFVKEHQKLKPFDPGFCLYVIKRIFDSSIKRLVNKIVKRKLFFFFPYYHTGGSEKAHLFITNCLNKSSFVIFTDRSRDDRYKKEFYKNNFCIRLFGIQNKIKIIEKFVVFIAAFFINRVDQSIVFGSNSRFFYMLTDKLNNNVKVIDLVHWLDGNTGKLTIEKTKNIDQRIIITKKLLPVLKERYLIEKINKKYLNQIKLIENCVEVPAYFNKKYNKKLKVVYVGRNTYEKRVELAVGVWHLLKEHDIEFSFVGRGVSKALIKKDFQGIVSENTNSDELMGNLYKSAHIIILTSLFEGFPYVFMEAMSYGVVPISTNVGGISTHLKDGNNSFLTSSMDGKEIINDISSKILQLDKDREKLKLMSENAYNYAKNNFNCRKNCLEYNNILKRKSV